MKKRFLVLAAAMVLAVSSVWLSNVDWSHAQNILLNPGENTAVGLKIPVFNATDSLITDGCLVYADTTTAATTNIRRIAVKPANAIARTRVVGIAVGNIQRSSRGGYGTVLVWGYHPNAWLAASNIGVNAPLKISMSVYGRFALADTQGVACGYLISMNSATPLTNANGATAVVYRGKVWFMPGRSNGQSAL